MPFHGRNDRLETTLAALLREDTSVADGETEIVPGDPKIVSVVDDVIEPMVRSLKPDDMKRTPEADMVARFGPPSDSGLLIQTYVVCQHANLADDVVDYIVEDGTVVGIEGRAAVGRGATQIKGPMAAAFEALARLPRTEFTRPVWLSVNTEGMSSHRGSERVLSLINHTLAGVVISIGTDLRISLGNRGRVDVMIIVGGDAFHSSQPWLGSNAIEHAAAVVRLLEASSVAEEHPLLGPASITPYGFSCHPIAPHTVPSSVTITLDRRLLPGESLEIALQDLRDKVSPVESVEVKQGAHLLPVIVNEGDLLVRTLREGLRSAGRADEVFYSDNAFDAGYAFSQGIPSLLFGPGRRRFSGEGLLGSDAVAVADCESAAETLAFTVRTLCCT